MPDKIKILSYQVQNIWWCNTDQPTKVMGSPLKSGSLGLLVNRLPKFVYQRDGNLFYAVDDGFVGIFERNPGTKDAFGGREFDLQLNDGTVYHSTGDLWDPFSWKPFINKLGFGICSVGVSTREEYRKCPVYCSYHIDIRIIHNLLDITVGRHGDSQEENKEAVEQSLTANK
jgi:hypothetical protein